MAPGPQERGMLVPEGARAVGTVRILGCVWVSLRMPARAQGWEALAGSRVCRAVGW